MGQKGADAHHVGLQLLEKEKILGQMLYGLSRGANHKTGTGLVAQLL